MYVIVFFIFCLLVKEFLFDRIILVMKGIGKGFFVDMSVFRKVKNCFFLMFSFLESLFFKCWKYVR